MENQFPKPIRFLITVLMLSLTFFASLIIGKYSTSINQRTRFLNKNNINDSQKVTKESNITKDAASWDTYTDKRYGLSFKYPPNWVNRTWQYSSEDVIASFGEDFLGTDPGSPIPLTFTISQSLGERPITEDLESEIINRENVFIDEKNYQLVTYKRFEIEASDEISEIIEIPIKDKILYLNFTHITDGCLSTEAISQDEKQKCIKWNKDKLLEYRILRNQILTTFKFIN